jgi:hypothetical protein
MNFNTLNSDTNCKCTKDATVDNISKFALKMNKSVMRENDFKTYWEKGKRSTDCVEICSYKGQSLTIVNSKADLDATIDIYKKLFPFSPSYKTHCAVITLNENSGLVKSTPSDKNRLHYDFYKEDGFNIDKITTIQIIPLSDV